ncbi:winged helix-turn-helix transcriptional regulator [Ferrimonas gelatinilytica]
MPTPIPHYPGDKVEKAEHKVTIEPCMEPCPIERGMRIIGGKWKGSILWHLKEGPVRFNDLTRMLGGASKKMVNQRLKEMEAQGLLVRTVLNDRPIAVSYTITEFGRSSLAILEQLKYWAEKHDI